MSDPNKDRETIRKILDQWLEPPEPEEDLEEDDPYRCEKCGGKFCDH